MAQVSGRLTGSCPAGHARCAVDGASRVDPGRSDFTIADVLAWARTKPADEAYDYTEAGHCAVAQFGLSTGRPHLAHLFSWELDALAVGLLEAVNPGTRDSNTFGALVTRLEALCPDQVIPPSEWTWLDSYMTGELASA